MYTYRAKLFLDRNLAPIYDGDSLRLTVDLGFGIRFDLGMCRLYGIDAPEVRGSERQEGLLTRDYVRQLFADLGDDWFTVKTFKDTKGKYGRYLVDIYLDSLGGESLSDHLVSKGLAEYKDY